MYQVSIISTHQKQMLGFSGRTWEVLRLYLLFFSNVFTLMKLSAWLYLTLISCLPAGNLFAQKTNAEIFIPIDNRNEIWLKPRVDTLDNLKEYEFKIRVVPEYTISQFLFEKGLAIQPIVF